MEKNFSNVKKKKKSNIYISTISTTVKNTEISNYKIFSFTISYFNLFAFSNVQCNEENLHIILSNIPFKNIPNARRNNILI